MPIKAIQYHVGGRKTNSKTLYKILSYNGYEEMGDKLLYNLCNLGVRSFGSGMTRDEVKERALDASTLFVAYNGNKPVGFAGLVEENDGSFYLSAAVVDPTERRNGLYTKFTRLRIETVISSGKNFETRTQNPVVEKTIRNVLENMMTEEKIQGYNINREYKPAVYGRLLTNAVPKSGDKRLDKVYSALDYNKGDAFLVKFSLSLPVHTKYNGGCLW